MKNALSFILKLTISAGIVYLLAQKTDLVRVKAILFNLSPLSLILALGCAAGANLFLALRMRTLLVTYGHRLPLGLLFRQILIGFGLSQCLPSNIGGDVYRAVLLQRSHVSWHTAITSLILDRLSGMFDLALFCLILVPLHFQVLMSTDLGWMVLACVGILLSGVAALFIIPLMEKQLRWIPFAEHIFNFADNFYTLIKSPSIIKILFFSACGMIFFVLMPYVLAVDMEIPVQLNQVIVSASVVILITAIPLSLGGWGLREGAMVISLGAFGIPETDAVTLSVVWGIMQLLFGLIGLGVWLMYRHPAVNPQSHDIAL